MRKILLRQFFSWLSIASLLLQIITPFSNLIPQAYAQVATPTVDQSTVTPTDTITPTDTVTPTDTSSPTPTDTISPSISPTDTIAPTVSPTDSITPTDTITPLPTDTGTPTDTPTDTASPTPDNSNTSSQGPPSATTNPTDTSTPTPSVTPTVTPDNSPSQANGSVAATILKNVSAPSVDLSTTTNTGSATVTTNKSDYSPTDTALISGNGFTPNYTYTLTISSTDSPATSTTVSVTIDSKGNFVYAYQLDGNYRPNYSVAVIDQGTTIATTTFTDSATNFSSQTVAGACMTTDQHGKSLTATGNTCTANDTSLSTASQPTIIGDGATFTDAQNSTNGKGCQYPGDYVKFSTSWQIATNASQRYNFGLWFATAGQTNVTDGGQCSITSLPSSPAPFFESQSGGSNHDSCGDMNSGASGTVNVTMVAVCNPDNSGLLKLPYCTSWAQNDNSACTNPTQTLPDNGSKCSCNSGFTIPVIIPPSIEVDKVLSPSNDPGLFDLQVNASTSATNVGNGGSTGKVGVTTGSNTFGEIAGSNSSLSDYNSNASCVLRGTTTSVSITGNGPTWTIPNVTNGQDIVCTITNIRSTGSIELKKTWVGTAGQTTLNIGTTTGGYDIASQLTGLAGVAPQTTGTKTVNSGTYYVSESGGLSNYTSALACTDNGNTVTPGVNNSLSVSPGHAVICTFTNTLQQAHLTLVKNLITDNGGSALATAWTLSATGNTNISGTTGSNSITNAGVLPGTYTLSENGGPSGYTNGTYSCIKNNGNPVSSNSITLSNGDSATCTVTNDDIAPSLTLIKNVNNQFGGTASAGMWTLSATGPTSISGPGGATSSSTFSAGTYTLSESGGPSGYTPSSWNCTNNITPNGSNQITLGLGQSTTCSITNSDVAPSLRLVKQVTNDNGGTAVSHDFTLSATGTGGFSDFGDSTTFHSVKSNTTYTLSESGPSGYSASAWTCDSNITVSNSQITLSSGQTNVTCSITNDDKAATLIVKKIVKNLHGGTNVASDFSFQVNGGNPVSFIGSASTGENDLTVNAGTYSVTEASASGYTASYDNCTNLNIPNGGSATCTITNTDIAPQLTVIKHVVNTNGGLLSASNFSMVVNGTNVSNPTFAGSETGTTVTLDAGTYSAGEIAQSGYTASFSSDCTGSITVGQTKTCTITNSDQPATLIVIKHVINDNGGTKSASDFTMQVTGTNVSSSSFAGAEKPGTTVTLNAGSYSVDEGAHGGYTESLSSDCSGTIANGETKTCTITNDDIAPSLTLVKFVDNKGVGTSSASDFTLSADGPTPISGAGGATSDSSFGSGTYTLSETGPDGYTGSSWGCIGGLQSGNQITLGLGESAVCSITNTRDTGSVIVHKKVDTTGIGDFSGDDATASALGFTWSLDGAGANAFGASVSGVSTLDTHTVSEDLNNLPYHFVGWYPTDSKDFSCTNPETSPITFSLGFNDDTRDITLCNQRDTGSIQVEKVVEDPNGNVVTTDPTQFTFNISSGQTTIDSTQLAGGQSDSFVVPTGNYDVTEQLPNAGYDFKGCQARYEEEEQGNALTNGETVSVFNDETVTVVCTNQQQLPVLTITKTNNQLGNNLNPGNSVIYTLTITATQAAAQNVVLTDLLPKGFHYVDGSATIDTGDESGPHPFTNFADDYHSPGIWDLGNIANGQTFTLSLTATIDGSQNPGLYKDVAYANGQSLSGDSVSANSAPTSNAIDNGVVDQNFVGTQANVVTSPAGAPFVVVQNTVTQQVLGASTSVLPETGSNTLWVILATLFLTMGLASISMGFILRKRYV